MTSLLKEADYEEDKRVRWKHRKLKKRLIDFRMFLYDNLAYSTATNRFGKLLTFYRHYDIEIHPLPYISLKNVEVNDLNYKDLLTADIIQDSLIHSDDVMTAVILFMASSGTAKAETMSLTVQDFINATYEYHETNDIKEALAVLKHEKNVIPQFRVKRIKTNKYYYTFCSYEACSAIVKYLLSESNVNSSDKLFNRHPQTISTNLTKYNNILGLGKVGYYSRLRTHMLRKFHSNQLYNDGMDINLVDALQGRSKTKIRSSYFVENPKFLKKSYEDHLDVLLINK